MENFLDVVLNGLINEQVGMAEYFRLRAKKSEYQYGIFLAKCMEVVESLERNVIDKVVPLFSYTNGKTEKMYVGSLHIIDILKAKQAITEAGLNQIHDNIRELEKLQKIKPEPENPHTFIFPDGRCWLLFEDWKNSVVDLKADLCFIYWKMLDDKLINDIKPNQYKAWLLKSFDIDFGDYWKQLYRVKTEQKERSYSLAKLRFIRK